MPLLLRLFIDLYCLEDPGQRGLWRLYGLFSLLYGLFASPINELGRPDGFLLIDRIVVFVITDYFAVVFF